MPSTNTCHASALTLGSANCRPGKLSPKQQRVEFRDEQGCTWQPSCRLHVFSPSEACALLEQQGISRIMLLGDSLIRHLYLALLLLLFGDAADADSMILAPTQIWSNEIQVAARKKILDVRTCSHHRVATDYLGKCRMYFARDTWLHLDDRRRRLICNGKVNLEYHGIPCCHCMMDTARNLTKKCSGKNNA